METARSSNLSSQT